MIQAPILKVRHPVLLWQAVSRISGIFPEVCNPEAVSKLSFGKLLRILPLPLDIRLGCPKAAGAREVYGSACRTAVAGGRSYCYTQEFIECIGE